MVPKEREPDPQAKDPLAGKMAALEREMARLKARGPSGPTLRAHRGLPG